jgi:hypothetical protein
MLFYQKQAKLWQRLKASSTSYAKPHTNHNWLVRNKDAFAALQSLLTIAALLLALLWFQGQHQSSSKLIVEQSFSSRPYLGKGHTEGERLLSVQVWVKNVGVVANYLDPGKVRIDEVNPQSRRLYCHLMGEIDKPEPCDPSSVDPSQSQE